MDSHHKTLRPTARDPDSAVEDTSTRGSLVSALFTSLSQPAFVLTVGQMATAASAFGMNLFSSNALQPEDRGLLAFFIQMSYMTTVFGLLGVERPFVAARTRVNFSRAYQEISKLTRLAWLGSALLAVVAVLLAVNGHWLYSGLTLAAGLYVLTNVSTRKVRIAYIVSKTRAPLLLTIVGSQLSLLVVGTLLYVLDVASALPWLLAYGLTGFIAPLVALYFRRREGDLGVTSQRELGKIRREGLRLLPASFGNTALLRADRLLLPVLSTTAELGRYVAVATIMEIGTWPVQQWVDASLGKWRSQVGGPRRSVVALAIAASVVITCAFAGATLLVIRYWLPADYQEAEHLLLPLAIGTVMYAATRVQQGLMIARGYPGAVSIAETAGLVASFALYLSLMPTYGAMGAALGSAGGYLVLLVAASFMQWLKRSKGISSGNKSAGSK